MAYKDRNKKKTRSEILQALTLLSQIGITMAITLFISVMIGKWLDDLSGASPIFLLIFGVIGILAAFRNLFIITKKYWK